MNKVKIAPSGCAELRNFPNQGSPFYAAVIHRGSPQFPPGVLPVGTEKYGLVLTPIFFCVYPSFEARETFRLATSKE